MSATVDTPARSTSKDPKEPLKEFLSAMLLVSITFLTLFWIAPLGSPANQAFNPRPPINSLVDSLESGSSRSLFLISESFDVLAASIKSIDGQLALIFAWGQANVIPWLEKVRETSRKQNPTLTCDALDKTKNNTRSFLIDVVRPFALDTWTLGVNTCLDKCHSSWKAWIQAVNESV